MHSLLLRQFKKTTGIKDRAHLMKLVENIGNLPDGEKMTPEQQQLLKALPDLLTRISQSYEHHDRDRSLASRSMQLSSDELFEANKRLLKQNHDQSQAMRSLIATAQSLLNDTVASPIKDDVASIGFISELIADLVGQNNTILNDLNNQKFAMDEHAIISITDPDGRIIYANEKFCESSGYSFEELKGQTHSLIKSDYHPPEFFDDLWQTIQAGKVWHGEICNKAKEGHLYWVSATLVPLKDADHNIVQYIAIRTDITERIKAEQAAKKAREEADFANKAKSEFLSNMSHELRTPLNALMGFAQLLQMNLQKLDDTPVKSKSLLQLRTMLNSGEHLLSLIDEVLDLAKIESGKLSLSVEKVHVAKVIDETMQIADTLPHKYNPNVQVHLIRENLDQHIWVDITRFRQLLLNLITNAIKYNKPDGAVYIRIHPAHESFCRIEVEDTGHGIDENQQQNLFVPFERLGAEQSTIEGTGIGLALCHRLVDALGGKMGFHSEKGKGSSFWFELPHTTAPSISQEQQQTQKQALENYAAKKVLYIEDNALNIQLLENFFETYPDIIFISALDGKSGVSICRQFQPDIIFLDMNLPDHHGFEIYRQIRNLPHFDTIPIIALSADISKETVERAQALGITKYLAKPLNFNTLISTLNDTFTQA